MRILLIEDDVAWQIKIRIILEALGWELVKISPSVDTIWDDIESTQPNLVISDIVINDISIFSLLYDKKDFPVPVLFITNYPSDMYYENTKCFKHSALLIKPFHELTLKSTVDLLFEHLEEPVTNISESTKTLNEGIWVKEKHNIKVWIKEENILWIHANGNYCFIQTETAKYSVKAALRNLLNSFSQSVIQIHRAYLVNTKYIQKIELSRYNLLINKQELPISRKYKAQVVKYLLNKEELKK